MEPGTGFAGARFAEDDTVAVEARTLLAQL